MTDRPDDPNPTDSEANPNRSEPPGGGAGAPGGGADGYGARFGAGGPNDPYGAAGGFGGYDRGGYDRGGYGGGYGGGPGSRLFDDLARFVTDAAGATQGVRREVETAMRAQAEQVLGRLDVVRRDEFEAMSEVARRARAEADALRARVDALEARLGGAPGGDPQKN